MFRNNVIPHPVFVLSARVNVIQSICIFHKYGDVNHFLFIKIFAASECGDLKKTLTYWRSLILAVSQFNVLYNYYHLF